MTWNNGYIDKRELTVFRTGRNGTDGEWYHGLTPATYARHLELVRIAKARTGRTLEISDGWGAYRPYDAQVIARRVYGNGAAVPGTSSHGGYWERRETMAMDYSNWSWVYGGNRQAFYDDVRRAGLTPGMISEARGYPDEPWHVIDINPRIMPSFAGNDAKPIEKEWDEMASEQQVENAAYRAALKAVNEVLGNGTPRGTYIWTLNRGGALVDPSFGAIKLAGEEAETARELYGHGPEMNDRQWDVAFNLAQRLAEQNAALVAASIKGTS